MEGVNFPYALLTKHIHYTVKYKTMKKNNIIQTFLLMTIFFGSVTVAQSSQSMEKKKGDKKATTPIVNDLNADGIDDTKELQQSGAKQKMKMHDRFIDTNGDGICDTREQGLGFRRGKTQSPNQSGKRQQGKQK